MKYQYMADQARTAFQIIASASTDQKNKALSHICKAIERRRIILDANSLDLKYAKDNGLDEAFLDRLELNNHRIDLMIDGLKQIIALPDPIGEISEMTRRPSGIEVGLMRQPLGIIGIIYEARPNVTVDAAGLCLKSGNACILRGGSEAFHSNQAIANCISEGLASASLPDHIIQVAPTADRSFVGAMIAGDEPLCDVIIPRGGKGLIKKISNEARIPVIKHLDGNCHVYVDSEANLDDALNILENAKTHRYGVCNAAESFLIHKDVAGAFLPELSKVLSCHGVEIRGCGRVCELLPDANAATLEDWSTEYLGPVVSIAIIDSINEAIAHINRYGSHHTDAIVSNNYATVRSFIATVDSASVIVNASTRFADGFEYGLGAEIGISTDRIHVRGPVGLVGLTNQKWVVFGNGEVRQ